MEARGIAPNIPPKANRVWKTCFSPVLYRARNAIERMFCRLKDFRAPGLVEAVRALAAEAGAEC